jgi:hypothetical protein
MSPREVLKWDLTFAPGDPGQEVIGIHPINPDNEITYTNTGVKLNWDCSLTYSLNVTNNGEMIAEFYFRGDKL